MPRLRAALFLSTVELCRRVTAALSAQHFCVNEYALKLSTNPALAGDSDLILLECRSREPDPGIALARSLRQNGATTPILILATDSSEQLAIDALHAGANEYLRPPFDFERMAAALVREPEAVRSQVGSGLAFIGESPAIRAIKGFLPAVAVSDSNVLIVGETGTGKERVAEQIHCSGARRKHPLVCINSAAIPDTLLESELFGYEKGAFTGAASHRAGRLAQANGGTVFFDEIGDMSLFAQAKILRAIETKEVCPLGGMRKVAIDVRIIAATNRNLEAMMKEERFRTDLYYRLNVARIELPPLRERISDIPLLIEHLLPQYNRVYGRRVERFDDDALAEMMSYNWPGNVRELKNVLEITFLNVSPATLIVRQIPQQVRTNWSALEDLPTSERDTLLKLLLSTRWNVSEAARKMHWSRMTMYRKLAKHNISPDRTLAARAV
jgi:DNA-binding NtrC family response regulator